MNAPLHTRIFYKHNAKGARSRCGISASATAVATTDGERLHARLALPRLCSCAQFVFAESNALRAHSAPFPHHTTLPPFGSGSGSLLSPRFFARATHCFRHSTHTFPRFCIRGYRCLLSCWVATRFALRTHAPHYVLTALLRACRRRCMRTRAALRLPATLRTACCDPTTRHYTFCSPHHTTTHAARAFSPAATSSNSTNAGRSRATLSGDVRGIPTQHRALQILARCLWPRAVYIVANML